MKFPFFKRRKNKAAEAQPRIVRDFSSGGAQLLSDDSTAFACIDKIAGAFASLNYAVYNSRTRLKMPAHPLMRVLREPNLEDGHFNFFYQSAVDYFNGGCYWLLARQGGQLVSLFRLNPAQVRIRRREGDNEKEYLYEGRAYSRNDVLHIPARFGYSTLRGGQPVYDAARSVFQTARDLEEFTQASFSNGGNGRRLVIDVQGAFPNLTNEQAEELRTSFAQSYGGARNAGKPILKKKGMEYSELGAGTSDNRSAELAENRRFQEHEIAKVFGIPAGILDATASGDLENVFTLFNEFAVKPLATQFQEAVNTLLDGNAAYFEFDYNGLMKVSLAQRMDAYIKQIGNGLLSPNEARAKENLAPIEAGDTYFMPVNLMPLNEETVEAYMAKQKQTIASGGQDSGEEGGGENPPQHPDGGTNPTDPDAQHFPGGDDKQ